jgi:nucleoside-diphosphate-sugar epimerase
MKTLVIFEKDFKRNYVRIRDVAGCFLHSIDHAPRMVGRAYNVGLDAANLSEAKLVMKVKKIPSQPLYPFFRGGERPGQVELHRF